MSTAYLILGPAAAGKSTLALQWASERNAVRFAVDEWTHELFAPDAAPAQALGLQTMEPIDG